MANLTSVTLTAGVPTAGTGTVGTIDNVTGTAGSPSVPVLTVQGVGSGTPQPVSGTVTAAQATAASLNATVVGTGTFAAQLTGATNNINNIAGTVSLPTGASTSALQTTGNTSLATIATGVQSNAAIGSTTSGQTGGLAMGAVTTAAPTYTTAQTNPLSLDTAGNLRVNVVTGGGSGGTSSTVGSAAPTTATAIGFTDGTNMQLGVIKPASTAPLATDKAIVVAISPNSVNANGRNTPANSAPVVLNSMTGTFVAASATATQLGSTGATGDVLDGILVIPATAAAGAVSVLWDGTNTRTVFAGGGTTALPTLAPFYIPLGFLSGNSGGFKITTGTNVSVICTGNFT